MEGNSTRLNLLLYDCHCLYKLKVRLVFVKARNSTDRICIVDPDKDLSPEQIDVLYGRRWSIEVSFLA